MEGDIVRGKDFALCKMIQILDVKNNALKIKCHNYGNCVT